MQYRIHAGLKWVGGGKKAVVTKAAVGGGCKGRIYYASGMKASDARFLSNSWFTTLPMTKMCILCVWEGGEGQRAGMSKR